MQALYARVVLWLIEPALKKRGERSTARFHKSASAMIAEASGYADAVLRSAGFDPLASPRRPDDSDQSPIESGTPRPPLSPQGQANIKPVFHGVAKGEAKWFEISAQAASPVDLPSQPTPLEVSIPAPAPSPETTASPGAAPSCPGDSPSCAEDPKTNGEKPLC